MLAKEVVTFVEIVPLRVVHVALQHVEDIQNQHLVIQEPAVVIMKQVLRPIHQGLHLASSWIVCVTNTAREQPGVRIHEDLFRCVKFTG